MTLLTLDQQANESKNKAAAISLIANLVLALVKVLGALFSGSAALLSEALHSLTDVVASFVTRVGIKKAEEPADENHPYGHARIEAVVGLAESSFLVVVAAFALFHSAQHLVGSQTVHHAKIAAVLLLFCSLTSLIAGLYVSKVAHQTQSLALQSNGLHLKSDFVASFAVMLALVGIWLEGWTWLDGTLGILVSLWLIVGAIKNGNLAVQQLIDHALPKSTLDQIDQIIQSTPGVLSHHRMRSRLSGSVKILDVHIVLPTALTIVEAHEIADTIEKRIKDKFDPAIVVIHVDPFDPIKAKLLSSEAESGAQGNFLPNS